jgi:type VI secretion system protein ImpH
MEAILEHFFRVPVRIQEFVGHWLSLGERERTALVREGAALGAGAVLGQRVWDRQHKFRIQVGPLTLPQYQSLLPGGQLLGKLVDWVRLYFGFELGWDVRLVLRRDAVPPLVLGRGGRLGWTTWVGARRDETDADDLCLDAETFVGRGGVPAV